MASSESEAALKDINQKMEIVKRIVRVYEKDQPPNSADRLFEAYTGFHANIDLLTNRCSFSDWSQIKKRCPPNLEDLRNKLQEWYIKERKPPNVEDIAVYAEISTSKSLNEYFYQLAHYGYVWKQIPNTPKAIFIQKYELIASRLKYLIKMKEYRKECRHIVYLEDCTNRPNVKYQSFIAISNKQGLLSFVMSCENGGFRSYNMEVFHLDDPDPKASPAVSCQSKPKTIFTCPPSGAEQARTRCYPPEMVEMLMDSSTLKDGLRWLEECVLKTVNEPTVFVCEGFPFTLNLELGPYSSKSEMKKFLDDHDVPYSDTAHRFELYDLIKKFSKPEVDEFTQVLLAHGHDCVHWPYEFRALNFFTWLWPGGAVSSRFGLKNILDTGRCLVLSEEKIYNEERMLEEVVDKLMTLGKFEGKADDNLTDYCDVVQFDPEFGHASMFVD